jgi:hypothetical protein
MAALTKSKPSTTTASDNKNATPKSPVVSLTTSVSTKKGTFQWKIENYTGLRAKPGSRARTPIFSLCDEDWQLSLSPGGCRDSNNSDEAAETDRKYVGLFLYYRGNQDNLRTTFNFSIVNQKSGQRRHMQRSFTYTFHGTGTSYGTRHMILKDTLSEEAQGFKLNDAVEIHLTMTTFGDILESIDTGVEFNPPDTLKTDLAGIMASAQDSDLTIEVVGSDLSSMSAGGRTTRSSSSGGGGGGGGENGDSRLSSGASGRRRGSKSSSSSSSISKNRMVVTSKQEDDEDADDDDYDDYDVDDDAGADAGNARVFRAHSVILKARSPYIRCMLSTNMQEAASLHIVETEVEPVVFEQLLRWFYTDRVEEGAMEAMGEYLLLAANKYGCEALKQVCELQLCRSVAVESAAARLVLAEQAEAEQLKEACLEFIRLHGAEVMKTAGWEDVTHHNGGKLLVDLFAVMAGAHPRGRKRRAEEMQGGAAQDKKTTVTKLAAVDDMRVPELRSELSRRLLNTAGLKAQLVERLKTAIEEEDSSSTTQLESQSDLNTDVTVDVDTDAADPAQ